MRILVFYLWSISHIHGFIDSECCNGLCGETPTRLYLRFCYSCSSCCTAIVGWCGMFVVETSHVWCNTYGRLHLRVLCVCVKIKIGFPQDFSTCLHGLLNPMHAVHMCMVLWLHNTCLKHCIHLQKALGHLPEATSLLVQTDLAEPFWKPAEMDLYVV